MGHVQLLHCEVANQKRALWKQFKCNMTITRLIANEISLMQIIIAATLYSNYEFYNAMASTECTVRALMRLQFQKPYLTVLP